MNRMLDADVNANITILPHNKRRGGEEVVGEEDPRDVIPV